jgi:hypothetical protein
LCSFTAPLINMVLERKQPIIVAPDHDMVYSILPWNVKLFHLSNKHDPSSWIIATSAILRLQPWVIENFLRAFCDCSNTSTGTFDLKFFSKTLCTDHPMLLNIRGKTLHTTTQFDVSVSN